MIETLTMHHAWAAAFALISAFFWALAAILFRKLGNDVFARGMNLGKSIIASLLVGALILFTDQKPISNRAIIFLGISGFLGITLGDTFYFESLMRLGPRLTLIITTLIPIITILLARTILHESLLLTSWLGIFFTLYGVFLVLWERTTIGCHLKDRKSGIMYGVLSVLCCAGATIFSKAALGSTPVLQATFIRQISGVMGLIFWGLSNFKLKDWLKPLFVEPILLKRLFFASFIGTFLGTLFCILALKYTYATIATTLNATSPLFILPLACFILKEKISLRAVVGSFIAVAGISLIFLGGG
jgi:drug/metabolite transporter (DMT)-like permease